jgi:hypothetical protein
VLLAAVVPIKGEVPIGKMPSDRHRRAIARSGLTRSPVAVRGVRRCSNVGCSLAWRGREGSSAPRDGYGARRALFDAVHGNCQAHPSGRSVASRRRFDDQVRRASDGPIA